MTNNIIPFNKPYSTGNELSYISEVLSNNDSTGEGFYTNYCHQWFENEIGVGQALLTHSCTAALEMAAILMNIEPGDEVIMPSYTFVSTANAFVLRGGIPVFVDIRPDTLNIDERLIEDAITSRTRAIVAVHYAGVACEMDTIIDIAKRHSLTVVEDAAQGIMSTYKGRPLGSIGDFGCFSFHKTKNITSGEGGCLLVNNPNFQKRAEIIREKGTDRSQFLRGEVDKYTWCDLGSSYLPSEITAAMLWAQLEEAENITLKRLTLWDSYHKAFVNSKKIKVPSIPEGCKHNAHIYYLLLENLQIRSEFIIKMKEKGIQCVFHYVPLHKSPAGMRYGKVYDELRVTDSIADRLIRLPLWPDISDVQNKYIIKTASEILKI